MIQCINYLSVSIIKVISLYIHLRNIVAQYALTLMRDYISKVAHFILNKFIFMGKKENLITNIRFKEE